MRNISARCAMLELLAALLRAVTGQQLSLKFVNNSTLPLSGCSKGLAAGIDMIEIEGRAEFLNATVPSAWENVAISLEILTENKEIIEICKYDMFFQCLEVTKASDGIECSCSLKNGTTVYLAANVTARPDYSNGVIRFKWISTGNQTLYSQPRTHLPAIYTPVDDGTILRVNKISTPLKECQLSLLGGTPNMLTLCVAYTPDNYNISIVFNGTNIATSSEKCAEAHFSPPVGVVEDSLYLVYKVNDGCIRQVIIKCTFYLRVQKRRHSLAEHMTDDMFLIVMVFAIVIMALLMFVTFYCIFKVTHVPEPDVTVPRQVDKHPQMTTRNQRMSSLIKDRNIAYK